MPPLSNPLALREDAQTSLQEGELSRTIELPYETLDDLRLADRIQHALLSTGHFSLRNAEVTVHSERIILKGRVSSYFLKQLAQATTRKTAGSHMIINQLEVVHSK